MVKKNAKKLLQNTDMQGKFFLSDKMPDLKKALMMRGWSEVKDKFDESVDLVFTYCPNELNRRKLKPGSFINHQRGECNMTCKNYLLRTLRMSCEYAGVWMCDEETGESNVSLPGFEVGGMDAFFPKTFIINSSVERSGLIEEMMFIQCEIALKHFLTQYERDP